MTDSTSCFVNFSWVYLSKGSEYHVIDGETRQSDLLESDSLLELGTIKAEISLAQELFLHERT